MLPPLGVKLWNFAFDLQGPQQFTVADFLNYWIALPNKFQLCNSNMLSTQNETSPHLALRVALQTQDSKPNMKNQLHHPSFTWEPETVSQFQQRDLHFSPFNVVEINMCRPYYYMMKPEELSWTAWNRPLSKRSPSGRRTFPLSCSWYSCSASVCSIFSLLISSKPDLCVKTPTK